MISDLRLALRTLAASPGFAAIAILSMGLALGLSTTMFAMADAVVHPHVPFSAPDQLYHVHARGGDRLRGPTGYDKFIELRNNERFRDDLSAWSRHPVTIWSESGTQELMAAYVSPNLFDVLGVRPASGRGFLSADGLSAEESTVIVSERAWKGLTGATQLPSDANLTIEGISYSVVAVMPQGMDYPFGTDVWLPIPARSLLTGEGLGVPGMVLRIHSKDSERAAQRDLDVVGDRLSAVHALIDRPVYYRLDRVRPRFSRLRPVHLALGLAVTVVLLIACANLSTLILVRTIGRQRELAVRSALGASRGALVRVILGESAIVAIAGALLGLLIAIWGIELASAMVPRDVEQLGLLAPRLNWRVFAFGTGVACAAVLASSIVPAVFAGNASPDTLLKDGSGASSRRLRLRYNPLVIFAVALSLILLVGSGLLLRSSVELSRFAYGYDPARLLSAFLRAPASAAQSDTGVARFYERLLDRAVALEGIETAALFGRGTPERQNITVDDPGAGSRETFLSSYNIVSPAFLSTLGIPVVEGRDFEEGDDEVGGVAIVDETMARWLWPNASSLGRVLKLGRERSDAGWVRIIGVARSAFLEAAPGEFPPPSLYVVRTLGDDTREMKLAARMSRDPGMVTGSLARAANSLAPRALVAARVQPWTRDLDEMKQRTYFLTLLLVMFAGFGVLMAVIGLYGVVAHTVQQRLRELAVRTALGATTWNLARLVIHDTAVMVLAGIGLGAFFALWGVRSLRFSVFGLDTYDPLALLAAEAVLLLVTAVACVVPIRSAARADPIHVLRSY